MLSAPPPARVINIASVNGIDTPVNMDTFAYSSSKAAVMMLSRHLAAKLAPDVTVNSLSSCFSANTTYTIRVRAFNAEGGSLWSPPLITRTGEFVPIVANAPAPVQQRGVPPREVVLGARAQVVEVQVDQRERAPLPVDVDQVPRLELRHRLLRLHLVRAPQLAHHDERHLRVLGEDGEPVEESFDLSALGRGGERLEGRHDHALLHTHSRVARLTLEQLAAVLA